MFREVLQPGSEMMHTFRGVRQNGMHHQCTLSESSREDDPIFMCSGLEHDDTLREV